MSKISPLGWVRSPATFVAFHPFAVLIGNASLPTLGQDEGTLVDVGSDKPEEVVLVLMVVGRKLIVELGIETLLDTGGALSTRFAATSWSKSAFWPCVRSIL